MSLIGVTGATGVVGGSVARALAAAGQSTRLIVRDASKAPQLAGAEVATATYGDSAAMQAALIGVPTLFLVSATEDTNRVALHTATVDAAVAAGVERIVYLSFYDARADVADVAVTVLLDPSHDGRTYDLTGPQSISLADVVAAVAAASGRALRYHEETLEEAYASRASYGAPRFEVDGWVSTYVAIAKGELERVSQDVPRLAGHAATSFEDFLRGHPESYAHLL
jgi:uncharacterized protein YbjT (DUF2867 family)